MPANLRTFLNRLAYRAPDELVYVNRPVDPQFEVAALVRRYQVDDEYPLLFCDEVVGHPSFSMVTNVAATRRKLVEIMGGDRGSYKREFMDRIEAPRSIRKRDDGPVQTVVAEGDEVDLDELPLPSKSPQEPAPFLDSGVLVTRDDEHDRYNTAVFRMMRKGPRKTSLWMVEGSDTRAIYERHEARDEPMEFAMFVGHHPATVFASQLSTTADGLETLGGLLGERLDVVGCRTVDLVVPAEAEIVIEGRVLPHQREPEGPFGEYHYLLGVGHDAPVTEITAVTHREEPIYYDIYNPFVDHVGHQVLAMETEVYRTISAVYPQVRDVYVPPFASKLLVIVQIENEYEGLAKQVAMATLSAKPSHMKACIVVDEDADPYNLPEVLWSTMMKVRPRVDLDIVKNVYVMDKDPVGTTPVGWPDVGGGLDDKLIVDATTPHGIDFPERCDPPGELWRSMDLAEYVDPSAEFELPE